MSYDKEFQNWIDMWDQSQADMPRRPEPEVSTNSFFGLQQSNAGEKIPVKDADDWYYVYNKSCELFDPVKKEIITEEKEEEGFGKNLTGPGKDVKFNVNPTHFASIGRDQDLRVTKNWTSGDELVELAKMKSLLYSLESDLLKADAMGEKIDSIQKRLAEIKDKCDALSEKLAPDPKTDVS